MVGVVEGAAAGTVIGFGFGPLGIIIGGGIGGAVGGAVGYGIGKVVGYKIHNKKTNQTQD